MARSLVVAIFTATVSVFAQEPADLSTPRFDVVSVKLNKGIGAAGRSFSWYPGGRVAATNVPLGMLLYVAFGVSQDGIVGAPAWSETQGFDFQALGRWTERPSIEDQRTMLRTFLAERFGLRHHTEMRAAAVYVLVLARSDRKLGPRLQIANGDCAARAAAKEAMPPPRFPEPGQRPGCGQTSRNSNGVRQLRLGSVPMRTLLSAIRAQAVFGRVTDRTGLNGLFDIEIDYVPEERLEVAAGRNGAAGGNSESRAAGPSLVEALRDQLGLRLERRREPVEVFVIDRVAMPTPN